MMCLNKTLNKVNTPILTWGNPFEANGKEVIFCVTGNPGISDFYIEFAEEMHKTLNLPVIVVGQAGHEFSLDNEAITEKNKDLYNLQGQLKHKLDLIENYVDKKSKFHFIGHSIGSWMIVELLHNNNDILNRVSTVNLLFPTLQNMAETKNGRFINGFVKRMHCVILFLCQILSLFPNFLINFLLNIYLMLHSLPLFYNERIKKVIDPRILEKVFFLAFDEMDNVRSLNNEAIHKITKTCNVIYSCFDGWAPLDYMAELKKQHPHLRMVEAANVAHSFVLKSSQIVAEMVSNHIKEQKSSAQ
ncbi:lipid droplet-associated hydrolase isoform X1 [Danaus plexippus]|uniref:lipid droplet-associated hydrolase isoform X1 n=1 Tax=Danaus plexippus TaxID=13037 RepID=UPI002AAFD1C4|nr:lipid droplet-associated hydrolase isoform X1 [Danaus plexippus]